MNKETQIEGYGRGWFLPPRREDERRCGVMEELLKRSFDLWVKERRLKTIEKEIDKCNKLSKKLFIQKRVLNSLLDEYMKIYGEDLRPQKKKGGEVDNE